MVITDRIYRAGELPAAAADYHADTMTLGGEDRQKRQGNRVSDQGVEFGVALASGTMLKDGDCLVLDDLRRVVTVRAAAEPVFVIVPSTPQQWASYAYQIGNRHQPLMIAERELVCPQVMGVEQLLHQMAVPYEAASRAFTPVLGVVGHHHGEH